MYITTRRPRPAFSASCSFDQRRSGIPRRSLYAEKQSVRPSTARCSVRRFTKTAIFCINNDNNDNLLVIPSGTQFQCQYLWTGNALNIINVPWSNIARIRYADDHARLQTLVGGPSIKPAARASWTQISTGETNRIPETPPGLSESVHPSGNRIAAGDCVVQLLRRYLS